MEDHGLFYPLGVMRCTPSTLQTAVRRESQLLEIATDSVGLVLLGEGLPGLRRWFQLHPAGIPWRAFVGCPAVALPPSCSRQRTGSPGTNECMSTDRARKGIGRTYQPQSTAKRETATKSARMGPACEMGGQPPAISTALPSESGSAWNGIAFPNLC